MADLLQRTHPLAPWEAAFAELPAGVGVDVEAFVAMSSLRTDPAGPGAAAAAALLGAPLPAAGRWVEHPQGRTIWLGPDEWLVTSTAVAPQALEEALRQAVAPHGGSATDVSAQRIGLRLRGEHVRDLLSGGCSLDLHPRAFGPGAAASTLVGQAGVVLLSLSGTGDDVVLLVRSSFARYLADWLLDAALELAPSTG